VFFLFEVFVFLCLFFFFLWWCWEFFVGLIVRVPSPSLSCFQPGLCPHLLWFFPVGTSVFFNPFFPLGFACFMTHYFRATRLPLPMYRRLPGSGLFRFSKGLPCLHFHFTLWSLLFPPPRFMSGPSPYLSLFPLFFFGLRSEF